MSSSVLPNGGHVVIIGGGPGGASCALALQRLAAQMGRKVHITVLEGKRFVGEHHYNQCVGVLSPPLPALLKEFLDLDFPYHLSRGLIREYVLHATGQTLSLHGECEPSIALRRVQFDAWFLETVRERGIRVQEARAVDLEFHADRVVVYTESAPLEADVVVGAFGLDEGTGALFRRHTGYFPPRALSSIVTKYHPYPEHLVPLQGRIHAFLPRDPRIEFGAVTPKGNHLTINIAGQDVDVNLMQAFLDSPEVHAVLPDLEGARARHEGDLRFFKGRFPCSLAKRFYGDRYVLVGDAAGLVRAFKGKGVTSAVQSGIRAAETILRHGITRAAFHAHYRMANQDIIRDLPYGQAMRRLTIFAARTGLFRAVMSAARSNPSLQRALFDAVSAHAPYREVSLRLLRFDVLRDLMRAFLSSNSLHAP